MAFINVLHNTRDVVDWINTRCICTASVVLVPREEAAVVSDVARGFAGIEIEIPGFELLSIPVSVLGMFTAFAAQVSELDISATAQVLAPCERPLVILGKKIISYHFLIHVVEAPALPRR